jgi:acyl-CoA synthetase (NDP forming)
VADLAQLLFRPRSVALVGASSDPTKASSRPLQFLRRSGFSGAVYPVNRRGGEIGGEPVFPSISALPEVPDHAYLMTPTAATLDTVEECGAAGVRVVTVMSGGFGESGSAGAALQEELRATCARHGMRLLGPSSLGVVNLRNGLTLTANAAFAEPDLPVGGTFVASHSGSMLGALLSRGAARGLAFDRMVSVGGEADLTVGEVCRTAVEDPQVTGFLLFLESLRHGEDLRAFAQAAGAAGKPVVAFKLGRSTAAAELAQSHTGALAGEDDVATAFLAECGIARVHTLDAFVEALPLVRRVRPGTGSRVGVLTTTGGGAAMVVDQLGVRGVDVAPPTPATLARLAAAGAATGAGRIVDLTLAGTRPDVMSAALDVMLTAPEFDLVLATVGSSARHQPSAAVAPIAAAAGRHPRPLAAFLVPEAPDALRLLADSGVPAFRSPESCADAIVAALERRVPRASAPPATATGTVVQLDELASYELLRSIGVPTPECAVLPGPEVPFAFPVVAKALSAALAHKSDMGGVALGLSDAAQLEEAVARLLELADRVLVQPMVAGVGEVLVGFRRDPDAGPFVLVAPGGVEAELRGERSLRMAPVDLDTAREMLTELPTLRALTGFRGRPAGDLEAVAQVVVALSTLAWRPEVVEAEINPVIVHAHGCTAVDAVVRKVVP